MYWYDLVEPICYKVYLFHFFQDFFKTIYLLKAIDDDYMLEIYISNNNYVLLDNKGFKIYDYVFKKNINELNLFEFKIFFNGFLDKYENNNPLFDSWSYSKDLRDSFKLSPNGFYFTLYKK